MAKQKVIVVNDDFQQGYSYTLTEPMGENFAPVFTPDLSPPEMLKLGVFSGYYIQGSQDEFPEEWFLNAKLSSSGSDDTINYFGVHASQPLAEWQRKGWIFADDPKGWFQWYCRYYMGRRCLDDERQIKRWRAITRHVAQIRAHCRVGDELCRPKQRQALLHWAYDSRVI